MITAEIDETGTKIKATFPYEQRAVAMVKQMVGSKFVPPQKGGPHWLLPLDVDICKTLSDTFKDDLKVDPKLRQWAIERSRGITKLARLATADDAPLKRLPEVLPELYDYISTRPYQRADAAFMANAIAPLNSNQPGLGKTVETIASIFEAGMDEGPQLVIAPLTSLEVVWEMELMRHQDHPVIVAPQDKIGRIEACFGAMELYKDGFPFWLIINPAMVTYRRIRGVSEEDDDFLDKPFPQLFQIPWKTIILDEFHKMGLGNTNTLTSKAMNDLRKNCEKPIALSGTPIQGKPLKLYGILHFLRPDIFKSKWKFADQWLEVTEDNNYKQIHGVRPDREEAFTRMLSEYMVRRTKSEVLTQLPPKIWIHLEAEMDGKQKKQYDQFALEAEVKIEDMQLSATSILAEYTRLRQFADAEQKIIMKSTPDGPVMEPWPTFNSCKIPHIERLLEERGILPKGDEDLEGDDKVLIFSQFSKVVDMLTKYFGDKGYPVASITGSTKGSDRTDIVRDFQETNNVRVIFMTTTAGGVSITLDRADTVIFVDETWVPDDQEQAEDRAHRGDKTSQVTVYYIRSKGTIEDYVWKKTKDKGLTNFNILDARREGLKATED